MTDREPVATSAQSSEEKLLEELERCLAEHGEHSLATGGAASELSSHYRQEGDLEKALEYAHRALSIHSALANQDAIAESEQMLGVTLIQMGAVPQGKLLLLASLNRYEQLHGDEHAEIGKVCLLLGTIAHTDGEPHAEHHHSRLHYLKRAVKVLGKTQPVSDAAFMYAVKELAELEWLSGNVDEAQEILSDFLEKSATEPPTVLSVCMQISLGRVLTSKRQLDQAEALLKSCSETMLNAGMVSIACDALSALAAVYRETCRFSDAQILLKKVVELRELDTEQNPLVLAMAYMELCDAYVATGGQFEQREKWCKHALSLLDENDPGCAGVLSMCRNSLGMLYIESGRYQEAYDLLLGALKSNLKNFGKDSLMLSSYCVNLGVALKHLNQPRRALAFFRWAKRLHCLWGEDMESAINDLVNIAQVHAALGEYRLAISRCQEAATICERELGHRHAKTAWCYGNLGVFFSYMGRYRESLVLNEKALSIRLQVFGESEPQTTYSIYNIGYMHLKLGNVAEARKKIEQAIRTWENDLGAEHPSTSMAYTGRGMIQMEVGDLGGALETIEKVLRTEDRLGRKDAEPNGFRLRFAGSVLAEMRRFDEAERYCKDALALYAKLGGSDTGRCAEVLSQLGELYTHLGRLPEAQAILEKAFSIQDPACESKGAILALTHKRLGYLYHRLEKLESAEHHLGQALNSLSEELGENHRLTSEACEALWEVLQDLGKDEEAQKLFQRSSRIRTARMQATQ